ncbi:MAG: hypothetical protein ACFB15_12535 [Cyclobacteriaceae bacterium]
MNSEAVRILVENYTVDQLTEVEQEIIRGEEPSISVKGEDASEKLTHLLAAVNVLEQMKSEGTEFSAALRQYVLQVRESF